MSDETTERKILFLFPSTRSDLSQLIIDNGGVEVSSGSAAKVMGSFIEAAAGPLAPFMTWTLWKFPLEDPSLKGFSVSGFEPPPGISMQDIAHYISVGMVIVFRNEGFLPKLTKLEKAILSEIARLGGTASMGVLAERLNKTAVSLRKKLRYLELRGYVSRTGAKSAARYILSRPAPVD